MRVNVLFILSNSLALLNKIIKLSNNYNTHDDIYGFVHWYALKAEFWDQKKITV